MKILIDGMDKEDIDEQVHLAQQVQGVQNITHTTELGDSLKELNKDEIEEKTRMSGIDMRSRLHPVEISSILALDSLVALGICPIKCLSFTRQKKRLSVSLQGKGREEIVDIVGRKREEDSKKQGFNIGEGFKNFFGGASQ